MSDKYVELSYWQVSLAALLILINGGISLALRLGLGRQLTIASVRMTIQLLITGIVLQSVFSLQKWYAVVALGALMTLIAGAAGVERTRHRYRGVWSNSIVSVWASTWIVTAVALFAIVQAEPWYRPQYAIPLLGMILGNTLGGISLGLDRFVAELEDRRDEVETLLALGA